MSFVASDTPLTLPSLAAPIEGVLTETPVIFRWNPVPKATGYRVIVTTSPTSGEISEMELIPDTTAIFMGRLLSGKQRIALESGKIYYWKVIGSTQSSGIENTVSSISSFKVR